MNVATKSAGAPADAPSFNPWRDVSHPEAVNVIGIEPPKFANATLVAVDVNHGLSA